MARFSRFAQTILVFTCCAAAAGAHAADITGVWASNVTDCSKVFVKKGNNISFAKDADLHGSGFIIDGSQIRGRMARCKIVSRKEDGATIHLIASCATDIMLSNVQFSVQAPDQNTLIRIFPGMPDMNMSYGRCDMK